MSDLIDREDLIDWLTSRIIMLKGIYGDLGGAVSGVREMVKVMPSAEPEQRWIPVTEALPEEEKKSYWICTDTGYQCKCRWTNNTYGIYESNKWEWSIFDIPQYTKVVAWMPLPEPAKIGDGK